MLKSRATGGYYVGGKGCFAVSANACFFGVNIDPENNMILSFIISTTLFFLFLILVSVRSFRQTRQPAGRLLFSADAGMGEESGMTDETGMAGEGGRASREAAVIRDGRVDIPSPQPGEVFEDEYKENIYKGILWMKEKYEQYRDLADERYERLKEQLLKIEQKYEGLLAGPERREAVRVQPDAASADAGAGADVGFGAYAGVGADTDRGAGAYAGADAGVYADPGAGIGVVIDEAAVDREVQARIQVLEEQYARERQRLEEEIARLRHQLEEEVSLSRRQLEDQAAEARSQLELHMQHSNRQLEEKQRIIAELEGQQRLDRQKIEELVGKLRHNGQLLLNIYQELDKSLHVTEGPPATNE